MMLCFVGNIVLEGYNTASRAQGTQGLGYVCEFVGSMGDDPMMKNILSSTGCHDTIIRESLSGPLTSAISIVDNMRRRLQ